MNDRRSPSGVGSSRGSEARSPLAMLLAAAVALAIAAPVPTAFAASATASPRPRNGEGMAFDGAHAQVVVFGGCCGGGLLSDTWTWDGTEWTKRAPAHSPSARMDMGMAYDAADGQVVLFGGLGNAPDFLGDTWTWDGTDWTERHPEHTPSPRDLVQMAYDANRRQVVLFGGYNGRHSGRFFADTWTWNGNDWTKRAPAHSPAAGGGGGMADDTAHGEVVLFGSAGTAFLDDTWTWDGTDWTKRAPPHSPPVQVSPTMVYDAAEARVVLLGQVGSEVLGETWTWNGTDWTERAPTHSPLARIDAEMTYDFARDRVVLFGGCCSPQLNHLGDMWTWDGADWGQHVAGSVRLRRQSGPPGRAVRIDLWGFAAGERVAISFVDAVDGRTLLRKVRVDASGGVVTQIVVPDSASPGRERIVAKGLVSGQIVKTGFTVT